MLRSFEAFWLLVLSVVCACSADIPSTDDVVELGLYAKYPERTERLLSQIDLDLPQLASVKKAFEAGSKDEALSELINYFRAKKVPASLTPALLPPRKDLVELADDATRGIFTIQSRTYQQPLLEQGRLNWDDYGPENDKEWAWLMNRHYHFNFLLTAFESTRKDHYLRTISEHLIDWIPSHPAPDYVTFSTSWRALEAARRIIDSWLAVFAYARAEESLSDEALFLMLTSIPEHAESLRDHDSFWGGNHKMTEKMAIAICAIAWSEFRDSSDWLESAMEVTREELFKQTYPDGSYKELANHYQKVVAENYLRLIRILEASDSVPVDDEFLERIEAVWNYYARVARPSGFGPLNSDSSLEDNFAHVESANDFFKREDWEFVYTLGGSGRSPVGSPSKYFVWAGHAIMRNGWEKDSHWAFFDIGPNGSAHQHDDKLHLSVSVGQYDLLVDSGRYMYKPGPMRDYFTSGLGHNTLRVDGKDSVRPPNTINEPIGNRYELSKDWDLFEGKVAFSSSSLLGGSVEQTRTVIYFRNAGWLVVDDILTLNGHRFDTNWNFHPDCIVTREADVLRAVFPDETEATLTLLNESRGHWDIVRGQMEPEIRGWYSWAYNEKKAATSARYSYLSRKPHTNIWWIDAGKGRSVYLEGETLDLKEGRIVVQMGEKSYQITKENGEIIVSPF